MKIYTINNRNEFEKVLNTNINNDRRNEVEDYLNSKISPPKKSYNDGINTHWLKTSRNSQDSNPSSWIYLAKYDNSDTRTEDERRREGSYGFY